jgi:hypothetical protein
MHRKAFLLIPMFLAHLCAQEKGDSQAVMSQVLQRLNALEQENRELVEEVRALRRELDASRPQPAAAPVSNASQENATAQAQPPLDERVTVVEHRTAEQAQTKVEASQKFPISLDGMLLFNAFANSANSATENSSSYGLLTGPSVAGGTVRQTLIGLQLQGPSLPGGGRVNGSLMMDFWGGSSTPGFNWLRIRRADISLDWKNRSFSVGQDKPLISPYQPDSLAEVGIPPLAGAGNLWLWLPQARYEERLHIGTKDGFTGQLAMIQTAENYQTVPDEYSDSLEPARPGVEGRLAYWHRFNDVRRLEIGSGFHSSSTHVAGSSVSSRVASLDWHITPFSKLDFTGTAYTGQNVAGLGALGNGFVIGRNDRVHPIDTSAGWSQLSFLITNRFTLNVFGGIESDHAPYWTPYSVVRNLTYASNLMYHLGPNVVVGLEGLQMRTRTFSGTREIYNHYDLAIGYLF